jgi:hypothetical protein
MTPVELTDSQREKLTEWRDVLRNTDKRQTTGRLRAPDDGYCCLGVYLDHLDSEQWERVENKQSNYWHWKNYDIQKNGVAGQYLPSIISSNLGLDIRVKEEFGSVELQAIFVGMNDRVNLSFKEIAEEIDSLLNTGRFTEPTLEKLGFDLK